MNNIKKLFKAFKASQVLIFLLLFGVVCALGAETEKRKKPKMDESPIPLEWEGEYSGIQGFVKIRKMIMTIYPFSKGDKDIKGEISFFPSNPMDVDGLYGSYYFQGSYDDETGEITVQGNEWIAYPVDIYGQLYEGGLGFVLLQGIVDKVSNEIIGTSDHGIWQLTAKNKAHNTKRLLPLKWQGGGNAFSSPGNTIVLKTDVIMTINPFSEGSQNISGTFEQYVYNLDGSYNTYGIGEFKGIYDDKNLTIAAEEMHWLENPNIKAEPFKAILSSDMTKMDFGANHHLYSIYKNFDSNFNTKIDNNNFLNVKSSFKGSKTYKLNNDLLDVLCKQVGEVHRSDIKKAMDENWDGSSYGISATMGLVYEKQLSIYDVSQEETNSFYNLKPPSENEYFKDVINYYSLLQPYLAEDVELRGVCEYCGDDLQTFLSDLVISSQRFARKKRLLLFSYDWRGKGHTILITGYYFNEKKNQYELKICDPNNKTKVAYMIIKADFSDFRIQGKRGSKIKRMKYSGLLPLFGKFHNNINPTTSDQSGTFIKFSADSKFTLTTSSGRTLTYDENGLDGDLTIVSSNTIFSDNKTMVLVRTDNFDKFNVNVNSKNIDLAIYNSKGFKAVEGNKIETVDVSVPGDMKLIGKAFSFKAYSTVDQMINANEKGMASIAAKAKEEVSITKGQDTIEAVSPNLMSCIETKTYKGDEVVTEKIKGNQESVLVKVTE